MFSEMEVPLCVPVVYVVVAAVVVPTVAKATTKKKLGQQERLKAGTTKTSGVRKHTHTHVCTHKAGLAKCK